MVEINLKIYIAYLAYLTTKKAENIIEMKYPKKREEELLLNLKEDQTAVIPRCFDGLCLESNIMKILQGVKDGKEN